MALCQFLPGPASSQVGIAIGLLRAGFAGALAAWLGFTLPSALALIAFAYGVDALGDRAGRGWLHGLKIVAVAVVAQAVLGHGAHALRPTASGAAIAVVAAAIVAGGAVSAGVRSARSLLGGLVGWYCSCRAKASPITPLPRSRQPLDRCGVARRCSSRLLVGLPLLRREPAEPRARSCSMPSIAPARWCSAAATSCCRCCRRRSCRRAG